METKTSAKDFFINLGAIVALYTTVIALINLLFTVINNVFPQTINGYYGSQSVSLPVATLIIFFPIFIFLSWFLEKSFVVEPAKKQIAIRRWLIYITLFIAGIILAGDLVTVLYYFLDGQELTTGFLLKILVILISAGMVFGYYISDIREKLTAKYQKIWFLISGFLIIASVFWGFSVLGSPRNQQLLKNDIQKISDLQNINHAIINYYQIKNILPEKLSEVSETNYYFNQIDNQTKKSYGYKKIGDKTYELCAEFNKENLNGNGDDLYIWGHPAGYYCFKEVIDPSFDSSYYPKTIPIQ